MADGKKKKSVLEYQEINDFFRDMPLDAEQMEKVFEYLEASGIDVLRLSDMTEDPNAADRDLLLLDDEALVRFHAIQHRRIPTFQVAKQEGQFQAMACSKRRLCSFPIETVAVNGAAPRCRLQCHILSR